jgi:hypothetical protein
MLGIKPMFVYCFVVFVNLMLLLWKLDSNILKIRTHLGIAFSRTSTLRSNSNGYSALLTFAGPIWTAVKIWLSYINFRCLLEIELYRLSLGD